MTTPVNPYPIEPLSALKVYLEKFLLARASSTTNLARIIGEADFPKATAAYAAEKANVEFAEVLAKPLRLKLGAAVNTDIQAVARAGDYCRAAHQEIDRQIQALVTRSLPVELRGATVDATKSTWWKDENSQRFVPNSDFGMFGLDQNTPLEKFSSILGEIVSEHGKCAAELKRCEGVIARLSKK